MLTGKVALVTGASRGIGRQIAKTLAGLGATVIINYNGSADAAAKVQEEITGEGGAAACYQCNVADHDQVKEMVTWIVKTYKSLDILVNNAGITKDTLMMAMSEDDFDSVVNINLKGTFNCIKHASRQMLRQKSGRIVNISSVVGRAGNAGQANYAASKAGVIGLTMSAAKELGSRGITVNAVAPGFIATEMTDILSDKQKEMILKNIPLQTLGSTQDVANAVAFLVSEEARYITGQTLSVDGGLYMG